MEEASESDDFGPELDHMSEDDDGDPTANVCRATKLDGPGCAPDGGGVDGSRVDSFDGKMFENGMAK